MPTLLEPILPTLPIKPPVHPPIPIPVPAPSGLTPVELVGGLAGAIGSDFRSAENQLLFVEYGGKLSTFDLFPASTIVSQGSATLRGTFLFDLDAGVEAIAGPIVGTTWDIFWEQETAVLRRMTPYDGASIFNLGVVPFGSVLPSSLQALPYSTTPIDGNDDPTNKLVVGDVFAVRTNAGNFSKVLVTGYGYDLQIQWVTYRLTSAYNVIGTGYTMPEDVKMAADNTHAFVLEESGDLVKVALATPNRTAPTTAVIASGLTNPQQLALDEAHGFAYVVEYDATGHGRLLRVALTSGLAPHTVISTLHGATGLALSADLQYAYVSEQNSGGPGATGTVSRITLSTGSRQLVASGLVAPFHLTWADDGGSALLVAERDPANRISRIDLASSTSHVMVSGVAFRPSSCALASPSRLLICCDSEIESVNLFPFATTGPLFRGIGNIPPAGVNPAGGPNPVGLANTTGIPLWPYQVSNVPFGGSLPIMVNHELAANSGAAFFRVLVYQDPALTTLEMIDTAPVTDGKFIGSTTIGVTTNTVTVGGTPGWLPIHPVAELFDWLTPALGTYLDSTILPDGLNTVVVEFIRADGIPIVDGALLHPGLTIFVDNNRCAATIALPTLGGNTANPTCGVLNYTGLNASPVVMGFNATHPNNFATYSFTLIKGVNGLTPPSISGQVPAPPIPLAQTHASALLGGCTIAGFAESVYVAASANNGLGRQSQYDASAAIAFVLAP